VELAWYGQSCFRITERGRITIVTDPFSDAIGLPAPRLKADVVTISHASAGHSYAEAVKPQPYILSGPGEYEIGDVFITGIPMHYIGETETRRNVAYQIAYDRLTVLHLGDLASVPTQSAVEALGAVHVLLLPVGGGNALKAAQAAEVVALIEPHYIVPMHYALPGLAFELEPVEKFLQMMGVSKVQEVDTLKVTTGDLPEQPQVVVLRPQG
jgi:L-ascorbate metabolism protein UlaG (beta-lactamase superfamily)